MQKVYIINPTLYVLTVVCTRDFFIQDPRIEYNTLL